MKIVKLLRTSKAKFALLVLSLFVFLAILSGVNSRSQNSQEEQADDTKKSTSIRSSSSTARAASKSNRNLLSLDEDFEPKRYLRKEIVEEEFLSDDGSEVFVAVPSTGKRTRARANVLGEFPTQYAGLNETIAVRLALPEVAPDTPVAVMILDGGGFPAEEGASQVLPTDKGGGIGFQYTTSANYGTHRIIVRPRGHSPKIVDIWAAEDPAVASR